MQTLLLVKITTLLEQKKKTFSLRLKQIYSIISPNKNNKEFVRSVQNLECDPNGNIDASECGRRLHCNKDFDMTS